MTTDIERVRRARQWSVLGARTAEEVRLESKRLVEAGRDGALVTQTFAPPWGNVAAAAVSGDTVQPASGRAVARRPFEVAREPRLPRPPYNDAGAR